MEQNNNNKFPIIYSEGILLIREFPNGEKEIIDTAPANVQLNKNNIKK